jgi:hypothetical protein
MRIHSKKSSKYYPIRKLPNPDPKAFIYRELWMNPEKVVTTTHTI